MIIEISIGIIAFVFVVIAIYIILMVNTLRYTLRNVDKAIIDIRKHLDELTPQAQRAIEHTNQVSFDLKRKMESLNPIFNSLTNIGELLEYKTLNLKKASIASFLNKQNHSNETEDLLHHEDGNVADILELASLGARLWRKLKRNK